MPTYHDNYENAANKIIEQVGKKIIIGVPLGIGKPIGLLNALYRVAERDASIDLTIITGLTLARPEYATELEKRLAEPILNRLIKDYEDPLYEAARVSQTLPKNIRVIEFFLSPGKYLHNSYVQQNYISSNYTNVVRDISNYDINVVGQQVAYSDNHPDEYSLSCNSDLFSGVVQYINESKRKGKKIAIVAEINKNLPFMYGEGAVIKSSVFTDLIDAKKYRSLFALPHEEIAPRDHLIGLYTSCLIKDNSSLQVGIGKLSNAVANAVILRHQNNAIYREILNQLSVQEKFGDIIASDGSLDIFEKGLYAPTEMLSDEYIELYKADILKKRVYDHVGLQRLLNKNSITDIVTSHTLDVLLENKIIQAQLTQNDVEFLKKYGIFKSEVMFESGKLILPSGEKIPADLENSGLKIAATCLGDRLKSGKILHAGFFLGTVDLYKQLHDLSPEELQLFNMTSIARTNSFHWSYKLAQLQHQDARFVNSCMMITLGGVVISDGLHDLQEVSGVGGQFDFVYMAQKLKNARSIMTCPSTRKSKNGTESNIVWNYSNYTIPRFFRDIVVTEYGIADCRSKTDSEIIKSILNVTDSRFQEGLMKSAKRAGKLAEDYEIPKSFQNNFPEKYESIIREFQRKGYCKPYPFGTDLTDEEQIIAHALMPLKHFTKFKFIILLVKAIFNFSNDAPYEKCLQRMGVLHPKTVKEFIYKRILKSCIREESISIRPLSS